MIIAQPIKEIKIGDVDGNGYEDIFVITSNNKGIVYLNDKGAFTVDGKNVCLNANTEPDMINQNPEDFGNIKQMFVQDMDKDNKLDIVTNDALGDIKIFYGGGTSDGANYISLVT
ncbi:MAG: VCBS repeat-containing protein [bacterium]